MVAHSDFYCIKPRTCTCFVPRKIMSLMIGAAEASDGNLLQLHLLFIGPSYFKSKLNGWTVSQVYYMPTIEV